MASRLLYTLFLFFLAVRLTGSAGRSEPSRVQSLVQGLKQKLLRFKSLQADIEYTGGTLTGPKSAPLVGSGKLFAQSPDRLRVDMVTRMQGDSRIKTELVLDGKILWVRVDSPSESPPFVGRLNFDKLRSQFPKFFAASGIGLNNPAGDLGQLNPDSIRFLGKTKLQGRETCVLEGSVSKTVPSFLSLGDEDRGKLARMKIWVGLEDGITYQAILLTQDGREITRMRLTRVILNAPLSAALFRFVPPRGVTPLDMTGSMEEEIQEKVRR